MDLVYLIELIPLLIGALGLTLSMVAVACFIAFVITIVFVVVRVFEIRGLHLLVRVIISFIRGTPLVVQLFLFYFGLPQLFPIFIGVNAFFAASIGLGLHFGCYMAESLRGAVLGVAKNQMEAGLSIGLSKLQAMRLIILPQAFRTALPSLMNYFADLVKSTSLAFTLGVVELMATAQLEAGSSFKFFESYLAVALVYWIMISIIVALGNYIERRMHRLW